MAKITQISAQAKDKTRCNLYLDGAFCCGLTIETVVKNRIKEGMEIERETLENLQFESEKQTALDKALTHITHSMKTEKDLKTFLEKKGYLPPVVDYVMAKMNEYGFVDDGEYALRYASSVSKNKGKKLIEMELKRKGVEEKHIDEALDSITNEEETAKHILSKYMKNKEWSKENLYKAFRYLLSKGFDYEVAKEALGGMNEDDLT